jgi:hypothetical protein
VTVQRQSARNSHHIMEVPKGGELLKQPAIVRTDADGKFALQCERDLTIFRGATWLSVRLSFEHARYERFVVTYTSERATNNPNGEPLLETGDVPLVLKVK